MMIDLKVQDIFSGEDLKVQFVTQFINFVIVPFFAYGLGYLFFSDRPFVWLGLLLAALLPHQRHVNFLDRIRQGQRQCSGQNEGGGHHFGLACGSPLHSTADGNDYRRSNGCHLSANFHLCISAHGAGVLSPASFWCSRWG